MKKNILTIATGKALYINLAINLARSFKWWHPESNISFYIVTDRKDLIPPDVLSFSHIIDVTAGELPAGFSSKLFLDKLAPEGQTLFIDSDCLIFGSLEHVFALFKGHAVSVIGGYISTGEWFGDIASVCRKFHVPHLLKFNGGIYYIEKGEMATEIYDLARELEKKYDEIGFTRLRGKPNDEVIMALALQLKGQTPIPEDGTIMSDPQACPGGYHIDVINGNRWLMNPPAPHPMHQAWYPFQKVQPLVFHFLGFYTNHYPYKREAVRLEKAFLKKLNPLSELLIRFKVEYPERIKNVVKDTFRPLFHKIFGVRKVKISDRIVQ